jgi:hypothetical protein
LGDFVGRLIWLPSTIHSQFFDCFLVFLRIVIGKVDLEVEVAVKAIDGLIDVVLTYGLLWDWDEF